MTKTIDSELLKLNDLTYFAPRLLKIRTKSGRIEYFKFNRGQEYIHAKLEQQLAETGKVRAVILKGRQIGCSTYIQARYTQKILTRRGKKAYILTHEQEATNNLFEITKRYIDNLPEGFASKPDAQAATKLYFKNLDSGYAVGTAGNRGAGRSSTIQLFHGSEASFWPHAEDHAKGVLQAVSREKGTEIILESTANGIGNYFYNMWQSASEGKSEFIPIFVPWFWLPEYVTTDKGLRLTDEEADLLDQFGKDGLTKAHLAWRRLKIAEFSNDYDIGCEQFKQEYPMTAAEAFRNPIANAFISSIAVMRARKADIDTDASLVIGVDPAVSDTDKTAIIRRRGRVAYDLETFNNHNTMEIVGVLRNIIEDEKPIKMYIDCIGIGAGVVDRLQELGFDMVQGINVATRASLRDRYRNKRAELWDEMRQWLSQELPVQIPDDDNLHGALCSIGYKFNSNNQLQLESKDELRKRGLPSPDEADALSLTFYGGFFDIKQPDLSLKPQPYYDKSMYW